MQEYGCQLAGALTLRHVRIRRRPALRGFGLGLRSVFVFHQHPFCAAGEHVGRNAWHVRDSPR